LTVILPPTIVEDVRQRRVERLIGFFAAVTFLALAAVAIAAVRAVQVSHRAATESARADLTALEDAHELQNLLYQKGFVAEYFLTGDARWLDELRKTAPAFEEWLARVTRDANSDDTARAVAQLAAEYGRYDDERARAISMFQGGDRSAATKILVDNTARAGKLRELAGTLIKLRRDDVTRRLADGERTWQRAAFSLAAAVLLAMLGAAAVGYVMARQVARDVTKLNDRLTQAEKMSALGEMATAMAHEVLNPLTGVKTALQLLRRGDSSPVVKETVSAVDVEIGRVESLARRLMTFSRPVQPLKQSCDLGELFAEAARASKAEAEQRGITVEGQGMTRESLFGDPELIAQVLVNLTVNACQAMPSGGTVRLGARRERGWIVVEVRDEGEGVAPEIAGRLFTPFVTTRREGHGLGLAISQNIALAHGGRLEARSNAPSAGTTFSLYLPEASA
jgi:signal transduction histidine kinase